jgi:hypothetical protein
MVTFHHPWSPYRTFSCVSQSYWDANQFCAGATPNLAPKKTAVVSWLLSALKYSTVISGPFTQQGAIVRRWQAVHELLKRELFSGLRPVCGRANPPACQATEQYLSLRQLLQAVMLCTETASFSWTPSFSGRAPRDCAGETAAHSQFPDNL